MTQNQLTVTLPHSIKQIWSKLDNKNWSKLYKMWVTLLQSGFYRLFKIYFKSAKMHGHQRKSKKHLVFLIALYMRAIYSQQDPSMGILMVSIVCEERTQF